MTRDADPFDSSATAPPSRPTPRLGDSLRRTIVPAGVAAVALLACVGVWSLALAVDALVRVLQDGGWPVSGATTVLAVLACAAAAGAVMAAHLRRRAAAARPDPPALHDRVTGLPGPVAALEHLERELSRARRHGRSLSVAVLEPMTPGDDAHDDAVRAHGDDTVLAALAERLRDAVRAEDVPCRWSERAFVLLMPETPAGPAVNTCGRLRRALRTVEVPALAIGVAEAGWPDDAESLMRRALTALAGARRREGRTVAAAEPAIGPRPA